MVDACLLGDLAQAEARSRRILVRWEKQADTYLAMLYLACGLITY